MNDELCINARFGQRSEAGRLLRETKSRKGLRPI